MTLPKGRKQSLTTLKLCDTDVIGLDNLGQWGFAIFKNNTLQMFEVDGVKYKGEIISKLKELTKDRTPNLDITISPY